jgi:SAM-dependent methyltransferase
MGGMAESFSRNLQIWDGWAPGENQSAQSGEVRASCSLHPLELAEHFFASETMSRRTGSQDGAQPFSLQWFLEIESIRHGRHGRWLPKLLEFTKHSGDRLLGLGPGLGTDWVPYARHGAQVITCSPNSEQRSLVQRNFELRGLTAHFLHTSPAALPLDSASIDVVCLGSLLQSGVDSLGVVEEVYRVLKPGGKVLALARTYYDVDFWYHRWLPWARLFKGRTDPETPVPGYKASQIRRLFSRFHEQHIYKRHLRRSDVPHLWRWLPLPLLERLMGKVLVLKAFKPLSSAISPPLAA